MWLCDLDKAVKTLRKYLGDREYHGCFESVKPVYGGLLFTSTGTIMYLWRRDTNTITEIKKGQHG